MYAALTAVEKANRALQDWCVSTDPPPIGMDLASWITIVTQWGDLTDDELNEAGRYHWGKYWMDQ